MFHELFRESKGKEASYYATVLEEGITNGFFQEVETDRVGHSIMVVKDLIQYEEFQRTDFNKLSEINFEKIEQDVLFTVSLILKGIMKK